jgi:hypothetical protein
MVRVRIVNEVGRLKTVDALGQLTVQERILDVDLVHMPTLRII